MAFKKITSGDLAGKGVIGMADVPGLTASEMQAKVEEIVRDVVIPNINDNVDEIGEALATKQELQEAIFYSGSVSSVFGRAGAVTAQSGDYTPAQVGASPSVHANQHKSEGSDPLTPGDIGAATSNHTHGNISADGKIGNTNGLVIMTGTGGLLVAKAKNETGFEQIPQERTGTGSITIALEDNCEYTLTGVTSLAMTVPNVSCHGFITFGTVGTVTVTGATATAGDDITSAANGDTWEFSAERGYVIFKNWSGV